jgi:hypothetical protein
MRQAAATNDSGVKAKLYDAAGEKLKRYLSSAPQPQLAALARGRLATIEVERARSLAALALAAQKDERDEKLADARRAFEQARHHLTQAEKEFVSVLNSMPKLFSSDEQDIKQQKSELSADLAEVQLTAASIDYELAMSYERGSKEAKRYLHFAAERFGKIYEDYRTRGTGLFAHLWEGKCYQALGDRKRAMTAYRDLLELPAKSRELRTVRAKALRQAIEIWCLPEEKKYEEAMMQGDDLLATAAAAKNDPDVLAVRYWTAVAYQKQMATLGTKDPERKRLQQGAIRFARVVARYPGEFQDDAAKVLAALGGAGERDAGSAPTTFLAARDRGKDALDRLTAARMSLEAALQAEDSDPQDIALAERQEKEARLEAAELFKLALRLNTTGAKMEDINAVRYYVCYFYYAEGNYFDAGVIGEYLAYAFPQSAEGRQGARVALASWAKIYSSLPSSADKSFETENIRQIAEYVLKTWPDQEEAIEASATLIEVAIHQGETEKLVEYLERIPADSPRRGALEL